MNQEFLERIETETGHQVGYVIRCDDINRPNLVESHTYFHLWEYDKLVEFINLCEQNKLQYDLVIEDFNSKNDCIECEITLVGKNYKNQWNYLGYYFSG